MNNAVYAATTGLLSRARALDVSANNLANAGTAGFKRDELLTATFNEQVMLRVEGSMQEIGAGTHGSIGDAVYTDLAQGGLETTGRTLDFALLGDGFFAVQDGQGADGLTRNGSFLVNADGFLTTSTGAFVLGENGRLQLGAGEIAVSEAGEITVDGRNAGTLLIVVPQEPGDIAKQADGTFDRPGGNGEFQGRILQGHLERANVDMVEEMSAMMEASRAFQSCGQVLRILDTVNQKTVNDVGRA